MNKNKLPKRAVVGGVFIFLYVAPGLTLGQSSPLGLAPPSPRIRPVPAQRGTYISPTDYLAGVMLTEDQKAKINHIREETRSHLATLAKDATLGPEVKDAMLGGFQRIENGQIFAILTGDQQQQVRKRIETLRAAAQPPQERSQQPTAPGANPQSR